MELSLVLLQKKRTFGSSLISLLIGVHISNRFDCVFENLHDLREHLDAKPFEDDLVSLRDLEGQRDEAVEVSFQIHRLNVLALQLLEIAVKEAGVLEDRLLMQVLPEELALVIMLEIGRWRVLEAIVGIIVFPTCHKF